MWIFTKIGFVSAVEDGESPGRVLLRFRAREDADAFARTAAESLGQPPTVQKTPEADYLYRFGLDKSAWSAILAKLGEGIDYPNFKDATLAASPANSTDARHGAYMAVWQTMWNFQDIAAEMDRQAEA